MYGSYVLTHLFLSNCKIKVYKLAKKRSLQILQRQMEVGSRCIRDDLCRGPDVQGLSYRGAYFIGAKFVADELYRD